MSLNQLTMTDVISDIIETLAMMTVEPAEKFGEFTPDFIGHIDFDGSVTGRLFLECTDEFASILAENLLGIDIDGLEEAHKWDAIGEFLNIICGNIVTEIFDNEKSFTLSSPQVNFVEKETWQANKDSNTDGQEVITFLADGFPIRFVLKVNN